MRSAYAHRVWRQPSLEQNAGITVVTLASGAGSGAGHVTIASGGALLDGRVDAGERVQVACAPDGDVTAHRLGMLKVADMVSLGRPGAERARRRRARAGGAAG